MLGKRKNAISLLMIPIILLSLSLPGLAAVIKSPLLWGEGDFIPELSIIFDNNYDDGNDIRTAVISLINSDNIAGFEVSIHYDPSVFMPVNHLDGSPYSDDTVPYAGELFVNNKFSPESFAQNDLKNGILTFGRCYRDLEGYKKNNKADDYGSIALIGFKRIGYCSFEGTDVGFFDKNLKNENVKLYDWDGKVIENVKVPDFNETMYKLTPAVSNPPTPVPKMLGEYKNIEVDKNSFFGIWQEHKEDDVAYYTSNTPGSKVCWNFEAPVGGYYVFYNSSSYVPKPITFDTYKTEDSSNAKLDIYVNGILRHSEIGEDTGYRLYDIKIEAGDKILIMETCTKSKTTFAYPLNAICYARDLHWTNGDSWVYRPVVKGSKRIIKPRFFDTGSSIPGPGVKVTKEGLCVGKGTNYIKLPGVVLGKRLGRNSYNDGFLNNIIFRYIVDQPDFANTKVELRINDPEKGKILCSSYVEDSYGENYKKLNIYDKEDYIWETGLEPRDLYLVFTSETEGLVIKDIQLFSDIDETGNVYGKIKLPYDSADNSAACKDFKVTMYSEGLRRITYTNEEGYFCFDRFYNNQPVSLEISKPGFLTRKNIKLVTQNRTDTGEIEMWPGDVPVENVQDDSINIMDIMAVAKAFNKQEGSPEYCSYIDFNGDKVINIKDIMLVVSHFNCVYADYPSTLLPSFEVIYPYAGAEVNKQSDKLMLNARGDTGIINYVEFYLSDKLLYTDNAFPYEMPLSFVSEYSGSLSIKVKTVMKNGEFIESSVDIL